MGLILTLMLNLMNLGNFINSYNYRNPLISPDQKIVYCELSHNEKREAARSFYNHFLYISHSFHSYSGLTLKHIAALVWKGIKK